MGIPLRNAETLDAKRIHFLNVKLFATFFTSLFLTGMLFVLPVKKLAAQNTLDNVGLAAGQLPSAAFSLRKIRNVYAGSAIQVRRSSDNTIQNIGFTLAGELDQAALLAFVGIGNNGFVSIWYDQSINGRNAVQATPANQPRIVNAGAVEMANGKPTVTWTNPAATTNQRLECSTPTAVWTVNGVRNLVDDSNPSFAVAGFRQTLFALPANADFSVRGGYMTANNSNDWVTSTGTPATSWINGVQTLSGTFSLHTLTASASVQKNGTFSISSNVSGSSRGLRDNNHVSELILFPAALNSTDREKLTCNQTLYYGVKIPDQNGDICSGSTYNLPGSAPPGTTFTWGAPVVSPALSITGHGIGNNLSAFSQTLTNTSGFTATATYTVTPTYCGGNSGTPFSVVITVKPMPNVTSTIGVICSGVANFFFTSDVVGSTYTRFATATANVSGENTSLQSGATITDNLVNTTALPQIVTYTVTPTANGCTGSPQIVQITVNPRALMTNANTSTICGSTEVNIPLTSNVAANYSWLAIDNPNVIGESLTAQTTATILNTLASTSAGNKTVSYTVTPTSTPESCPGTVQTVTVIIADTNPTATISGNTTVCVGTGNRTITFTNPQLLPVTVTYNVNGGANATININANTTATATRSIATAGSYSYNLVSVAYQSLTTCTNLITGNATVVVVPASTITLTSAVGTDNQTLCENGPIADITYNITGSGLAPIVIGLPAGVTAAFNAGVLTITGASAVIGVFNYTITTTGPCLAAATNNTGRIKIAKPSGLLTATETSGTAGNDGVICAGGAVTFTATPGYGAYEFYVNGTVVRVADVSNTYSISSLNNNDQVSVKVFEGGCPAFFNDVTIVVKPLPVASLSADKTAICLGESITFTAPDAGVGTIYTFKINGVNTISTGGSRIVTAALPSSSFYITVDVKNLNDCSVTSSQSNITVSPVSTGILLATAGSFCMGSNITFTATAGFNNYEFQVNGSSVQGPGASNTFVTTALASGQVVSVLAKNGSGCLATFNAIPVTVNPYSSATLAVTETSGTANDGTICAGGVPVTLTATSGFTNYIFKVDGVSQQSSAANTFTRTTFTTGNVVTVDVTNSFGCTTVAADSKTITVVSLPIGTLTTPSNIICIGDDAVFTATTGFSNYNFSVNGTTIQNGRPTVFSKNTLFNGQTVTVIVTGVNGCLSTFSAGIMTVNALPTGSLVATENSGTANNDNIICAGATVTFIATTGFASYRFFLNSVEVQNGASRIYTNSTLVSGDAVSAEVTNGNGCKATFSAPLIFVNSLPVVAQISGAVAVCAGATTTLANTTSGGVWSSSSSALATINATSGLVKCVAAGTVVISNTLTNSNGCTSKSDFNLTVNALPLVAPITGLNKVCVGSSITLANAITGGTWSSINTLIATVGSSGKVLGVSTGAVTIFYSVTNASNCTVVSTYGVTVNALPVVAPITGVFSLCANGTTALSNATVGGTGIWTSNNKPLADVNPTTGLVTGVSAGTTASIIYTVTDANACVARVSQPIAVKAIPVPSLTGKNPICVGDEEIYITQSGETGYVWNVVGGTITASGLSTDPSVQVQWIASGTKTIHVNYSNSVGCTASTSSSFSNAPTAAPPTFTNGVIEACLNSTGNVYTTQSGKTDYTWTVNGGAISAGDLSNSITVTWNTSGAKSVSVNYSDIGGCNAANATVYPVTVFPLPTATISVNATAACANSTTPIVTFTGAGGLSNYTFTYTITTNGVLGALQTITSSGNSKTIPVSLLTPNTTYIYTLVSVQDSRSCARSQSGSVTVTINALPTVVTNPIAVCSPITANLTIASVTAGSDAGLTYTYFTNSGITNVYSTPTAATAGTYWIRGTTTAGCFTVKSVLVTVNSLPTAVLSGTTAVCINGTSPGITFTGANGTAPFTFTYNINGGANATITTTVGNTITLATPTNNAGSFVYNLLSVQDASSITCSQLQTGVATVTVSPVSVGGTVNGTASVCSGSNGATINLSGAIGSVIRWESSMNAGANWSSVANVTTALIYSNIIQTTWYRAVIQSGTCTSANSTPSIISVNPVTIAGTVSSNAIVCASTNSGTLNLTGNNGEVLRWEFSVNAGVNWTTIAKATSSLTYTNILQTTMYRAVVQNSSCVEANSTAVTITVNARPTGVIAGTTTLCAGQQTTLTLTVTGVGTISGTLSTGVAFSGTAPTITLQVTPVSNTTYTIAALSDANCTALAADKTGSAAITVNPLPAAPQLQPMSATFCEGNIMPLSAATTFTTTTVTFPSSPAAINLAIPDNNATGASNTINISTIPAGAIINSVSVQFRIPHNNVGDLVVNVKAPNSNVLNLVNREGGLGDNFNITTIGSIGATSIVGQLAPFNNTYSPEATFNVQGATGVAGNISNVTSFASLFDTPNGDWTLSARDFAAGTAGTISSWSIIVNYSMGVPLVPVVWAPVTGLFKDAGATVPYVGETLATVYARPISGIKLYSATNTNATSCSVSNNVTLTVNPVPVVSIQAVYCVVPGKVRLTATSVAGATFVWSTGQIAASIDVDVADVYNVVTTFGGCASATASFSVAQELVINGDFTNGNTGFITGYAYKPDLPGVNNELVPDNLNNGYGVGLNGQDYHPNFWGQDHTNNQTGDRNFMLVNGHDNITIWEQTVSVLPNTDYYFSAWAMNINGSNPARLRFEVNGVQTGTIADLNNAPRPGNNNAVNLSNWIRFYSDPKWNSGSATTATIRIINLNGVAVGNDFGLDDISFGTLSTFITLTSGSASDLQNICLGSAITPIEYNIGSGLPPIVSTLPAGLTSVFNGVNLNISGIPAISGDYTYSITATGCSPFTATGSIKVKSQKIVLSTGTSTQTSCKAAAIASVAYIISGEATGTTVAGLPTGVTMTNAGKVYTIAGTPSVAGVFTYTITTLGTDCSPVTISGTITVQEQTITLFSGSNAPTLCINTPLTTNIQYQIGGTGTGANASGLPAGVTGIYNGRFFIISGTPTAVGSFNYIVTTSGTCTSTSLGGTITVNPVASILLTTGNDTQTPCLNTAITAIQYTIGGRGNGANVSGLPAGFSGTFGAGIFSITGIPTVTGIFNYTVTTTGTCAQTLASGTITVLKQQIDLTNGSTTQTLCINTSIAPIIYTISGSASGVTITGLPAGLGVSNVGSVYTISGSPTISGVFNYAITTTGNCSPQASATGVFTVQSPTITLTTANNNQTPCVNLPISNIVYTIGGEATSATVAGLPAGIRGAYSNGTFTISGTTTLSGTYNFTVITNGPCTSATATGTLVIGSIIWTGVNSTNWSDAGNWSCGVVPVSVTNVVIPTSTPRMPQLTATSVSKDIQLEAGTILDLNGQSFTAFGSITGIGIIKGSSGSSMNVAANGGFSNLFFDQTVDGATNALKNFTVSGFGNTVMLSNKTSIYGTLLPVAGTILLNSELVLRSDAAGTARVGEVTGTIAYTATGRVTVERYYPMSRSWRLITAPLSNTGSIFSSWQASGDYAVGKGMFVTGPNPTTGAGNGLDHSSFNNVSMRGWNSTKSAYVNVNNTTSKNLSENFTIPGKASNIGYYAFIRGDRRRSPDNTVFGNMNNTTLSSTGYLQTGAQSFPFTGVASAANPSFELIGNPYASSVNFNTLTKTNIYPYRFFVFDPSIGSVGTFVTMEDLDGDGIFTPNILASNQGNHIQSSQAFFVQVVATGSATLTFQETDKSTNYNASLFRPARTMANMQSLRITLLQTNANNNTLLVDGTLVQFDDQFEDKVDIEDALKFTNITENLSLLRHKQILAIERRPLIKESDTLFLHLSRTTQRSYRFALDPVNMDPTVTAFLEDSFTKLSTPINMLVPSIFDFAITADANSSATNRFRIVLKQVALGPLPVTFKTIKANEQNGKIVVNWTVENELNIQQYEIEKSVDGLTFSKVNTTTATGANRISIDYNWLDVNSVSGNNFYRVRSIDLDGSFNCSNTVMVKMGTLAGGIRIYPNPVTDIIWAEFKNMAAGIYKTRLLNVQGQTVLVKTINHAQGTSMENIKPDYKLLSGIYQLEVTAPDKQVTLVKVIVK